VVLLAGIAVAARGERGTTGVDINTSELPATR